MTEKGLWDWTALHVTSVSSDGKKPGSGEPTGREPARRSPTLEDDDGGMPFTGEDLDRFMEMLERSNPRAFRELLEEDPGWV